MGFMSVSSGSIYTWMRIANNTNTASPARINIERIGLFRMYEHVKFSKREDCMNRLHLL